MTLGMGILLNAGKVQSWVGTQYTPGSRALNGIWPASAASTIRLGENFIKQGIPVLVGAYHILDL